MVWDEVEYDCKNWTRRDCWWDTDSTPSNSDRYVKNLWLTIEYRPLTMSSCEGISRRERDSAASQRRRHEGGSSQGVSGRRRDSAASQRRGHEGGSSQAAADSWSFGKYCCSRPNVHTKVAEVSEATCIIHVHLFTTLSQYFMTGGHKITGSLLVNCVWHRHWLDHDTTTLPAFLLSTITF